MSRLQQNKGNAQAFNKLVFNPCQSRRALAQYVGAEHIPHNPEVADGKIVQRWHLLQRVPDKAANGTPCSSSRFAAPY